MTRTIDATEPADSGWSEVLDRARPAVVELSVAGCTEDDAGSGTGFAIADDLVMTAGHMATRAGAITVSYEDGTTSAEVVGLDPWTDSALLRTKVPVTNAPLKLARSIPADGTAIAIVGFPLGLSELRITQGVISGHDQPTAIDDDDDGEADFKVPDALITDAATNPGNSGGPALDADGDVVGLVSGGPIGPGIQGENSLVPVTDLSEHLTAWRSAGPFDTCTQTGTDDDGVEPDPTDDQPFLLPDPYLAVWLDTDQEQAPAYASLLAEFGHAINTKDLVHAWSLYSEAERKRLGTEPDWADGLGTTLWGELDIEDVTTSDTGADVDATLITYQDPRYGHDHQACSRWVMTYHVIVPAVAIDHVTAHGDPTDCGDIGD